MTGDVYPPSRGQARSPSEACEYYHLLHLPYFGAAREKGTSEVGSAHRLDEGRMDLTDAARQGVDGSFVRLADGVVHYQVAGAGSAHTVVLGFSVLRDRMSS